MLKTFPKGGIHPEENKLSASNPIRVIPLPSIVYIPIQQHIGTPANPLVSKGDKVKVGSLIAKSEGFISTNIHSSVSGTVVKIDEVIDSSGYRRPCVVISVQGDEWEESIDRSSGLKVENTLTGPEIIGKIHEAGIVGLGGAAFPTHIKFVVPKNKKADVLIINGVECEPFLTSDHRLMMENGEEIMVGITLMMKAMNVTRAIIGIENNKSDAIAYLSALAKKYHGIEVCALKVKYPQGGEKQLIKALINREVPSGHLPIEVGTIVHNVGTAFAIYEAIQKNKPLFERVITISGKSVSKPSNFWVRIGTAISVVIEAAGGMPQNTGKVINGGPMMGKALNNVEAPVTKGTSGIILIPDEDSTRPEKLTCIRCAKCVSICPMGLEPYLLMTLTEKTMWERLENDRVLDCMECGSCSYICPSGRPLLDYIRLGKSSVSKIIRKRKQ